MPRILVHPHSTSGHTERMAGAVVAGTAKTRCG